MKRITYHACVKRKCTLALTPPLYKMKSAKCRRENSFFLSEVILHSSVLGIVSNKRLFSTCLLPWFQNDFWCISTQMNIRHVVSSSAQKWIWELSPFLHRVLGRGLFWKDEQRDKMAYREHLFCFSLSPMLYAASSSCLHQCCPLTASNSRI